MQSDSQATRTFYDRISNAYDLLADSSEHAAREKGLELLEVRPGESVLEIGYGTGHSLLQLAELVGPDGSVAGVDISQGMHDVAEQRVADAGLAERVDLHVTDVPPCPFADNRFDVVTLSFTLELFPLDVIPEVLADIQRVLRPGGRLGTVSMAVVPSGEHESLLEGVYKWMHRHFPHIVDCQPIDAVGLIESAGFLVNNSVEMKIWTMPVVAVVATTPES